MQSCALLLSTCCVFLAVIPTIEKLLNADWKEKLLDKSTVVPGQLKGQLLHAINSVPQFAFHMFNTLLPVVAIWCPFLNPYHVSILRCNVLSTVLISTWPQNSELPSAECPDDLQVLDCVLNFSEHPTRGSMCCLTVHLERVGSADKRGRA